MEREEATGVSTGLEKALLLQAPVGNFTVALADEPGLETFTATHAATPSAGSFPHTAVS